MLCLMLVSALPGVAPPAEEAGRAVVRSVLQVWAARRARAGTVRWRVSGKLARFVEHEPGKPPLELHGSSRSTMLLDYARWRYCLDRTDDQPGIVGRVVQGCDGGEYWGVRHPGRKPPAASPEGAITTGNIGGASFSLEDMPFFLAEGIVPTGRFGPGRPVAPPDPAGYAFSRTAKHEGRDCVVLRTLPRLLGRHTTTSEETWTDPGRGVIVRHLYVVDGEPTFSFDLHWRDGPQLAGWTFLWFGKGGIERAWTVSVESRGSAVPRPEEFRIPLAPGMSVKRVRLGDEDARGVAETLAEESLVVAPDGTLAPAGPATGPSRGWALWAVATVLGLVVVLRLWRRRESAS